MNIEYGLCNQPTHLTLSVKGLAPNLATRKDLYLWIPHSSLIELEMGSRGAVWKSLGVHDAFKMSCLAKNLRVVVSPVKVEVLHRVQAGKC